MLFDWGGRPYSHLSSIIITCMQFIFNYFRELPQYTQSNIPKYLCS